MASPVLLSPQEIIDLKRMCTNPFMELGSTLRPEHLKCFEPYQYLRMEWTDVIYDEEGNEHERRKQGPYRLKVGGPFGIPEDLVHEIMTRLPSHISRKFP